MSEETNNNYERFFQRFGNPTVELHAAYDDWLKDQSSREGAQLVPIEFDLETYPEQSVYVPKIDGIDKYSNVPDKLYYAAFRAKMMRSLGAFAYNRLLREFRHQTVSPDNSELLMDRLIANQKEGKNTMVVTSHFTFPELGYFKAIRFHGKHDRENISKGGVLLNKLMTRQSYKGEKLVDQFGPVANVYFSYPKSASAAKYGVPRGASMLGNGFFMKALKADLKKGGLELDVALTGRQIITSKNNNGEIDHFEIPDIDPASVKLIESFDEIFGATLIMSSITNRWEMGIGEVYDIKQMLKTGSSADIVDSVYAGIAKSVESFTGKETVYSKIASKLGKIALEIPLML